MAKRSYIHTLSLNDLEIFSGSYIRTLSLNDLEIFSDTVNVQIPVYCSASIMLYKL